MSLTTAKGVYGKRQKSKNRRKQINLAEAKKILGHLSQRDRAILLIMLQSGMEIGAVLNKFSYMWHSQVEPQLDEGKPLKANNYLRQFHRMMQGKVVTHMFRKLFKSEASVPERGINREIIEFFLGHINGIDAVGGDYDRTPEIYEEIFEREYAKLEPYINIYSGVQVEPLTEVDREWMKFSNLLRETLESNHELREKFLRLLDKQ